MEVDSGVGFELLGSAVEVTVTVTVVLLSDRVLIVVKGPSGCVVSKSRGASVGQAASLRGSFLHSVGESGP